MIAPQILAAHGCEDLGRFVSKFEASFKYHRQSPQDSSMHTGYAFTRHFVPVNGAFVFGANPMLPF